MKKIILLCCFTYAVTFLDAQVSTVYHPIIIPIKLQMVSLPLKSIPEKPIQKKNKHILRDNFSLEYPMHFSNPNALPIGPDPALQKDYHHVHQVSNEKTDTAGATVTVLSNWEGLSASVDPSDNNIAVGPDDVFQMTNNYTSTFIRIWDKSGNVLIPGMLVSDITGISDYGDPDVLYDQQADRYAFVLLKATGNNLIFCVSQTNDPTGAYYVYTFATAGGSPDYPKIAVWGNSYFITSNSNSPYIFALNRDSLLAGASLGYVQAFSITSFPTLGFQTASPVNVTGSMLPLSGDTSIIIRVADDAWGSSIDTDHLELFKIYVNWVDSSQTVISGSYDLPTISYNSNLCGFNSFNCVPQPSSNKKLDPLNTIMMDKVQYRGFSDHESIVCSHVVNADGNGTAGVRWYELRKENGNDWYIYQQGTYAPPDLNYRWVSSITINDQGTIAMGYNISSHTVYPGVRFTGRLTCDTLNSMSVDETVGVDGSAANGSTRYGDYNGIVTDPSDGSFWLTGQYNPTSNWSTNITHFTLEPCIATNTTQPFSSGENFEVSPNPASNQVNISVQSNADESAYLQIIDYSGKQAIQKSFSLRKGITTSALDTHLLPNGLYIVELKTKGGVIFKRVAIQQ